MNSIDTFYFHYYANRLLREGYIDEKEYRLLLSRNNQDDFSSTRRRNSFTNNFH